jgi:hypothetical protein
MTRPMSMKLAAALSEARELLMHFRREAPLEFQPEAGVFEALISKIDAALKARSPE